MKITLGWIKDHLETAASLAEVADALTNLGHEVEGIDDKAAALAPFIVGYVKEARPHPNADRLQVCVVDTGSEELQVVCGAPNAHTGMKGVFAPAGVTVPGTGLELKKTRIRGEESNGMLCSEREMGLSDEHEGIIELPEDAPVGAGWAEWAGMTDAVLDINITPNRGDCASARGLARDLAAAGLGRLKPLDASAFDGTFDSPIEWKRDFPKGAGDACPMVAGRYFRGVRNGDSPRWLQERLKAIGLRPISALVDITNWATYDLGRPLHVFDADAVAGDLTMRFARPGETIGALDGRDYALDDGMVVIADDDGVQGIAGVMGGAGSGCGPDTMNVFLEVALFDPVRIARAGRTLGIVSDARYRFERGVDPTSALWGAEIATRMILELCGGEASRLSIAGEMPDWQRSVSLRAGRVMSLGGVAVAIGEAEAILGRLGFETRIDGDVIHCTVPPWRPDVEGEADLVEEVLRVKGYDAIPIVPLARETTMPKPVRSPAQQRAETVRRLLAGRGLVESVTYSFMDSRHAALFGGTDDSVRLVNPISADLDVMRPSILPNLLAACARNQARALDNPALFEVGPQYADDTPAGQSLVTAGVRAGETGLRNWAEKPRKVDAFDAKGDALAALAAVGAPVENAQVTADAPAWYHPGRSGTIRLGKTVLARFGELHPRILRALDVDGPVAGFEIYLDDLPLPRGKPTAAKPLLAFSPFQPVRRDFAFIVDQTVAAADMMRAARAAERTLITDVTLFDLYEGDGVPAGKKSLAIAVTLQPTEATLTDAQIDSVAAKIVAAVKKQCGGALRG